MKTVACRESEVELQKTQKEILSKKSHFHFG